MSEVPAIDPDIAVHIDPVEFHKHLLSAPDFRRGKGAAIPPDSSWQIAAAAAGWIGLCVRPFNAPIVRQAYDTPDRVIEIRFVSTGWIAPNELPAEVRAELLTRLIGGSQQRRVGKKNGQDTGPRGKK